MSNFDMIKELSEAFGPTGLEDEVTKIIYDKLSVVCDSCGYSSLGGVWGKINGSDSQRPAKLIGCGIDEVAFMVGDIDDNGFIRPKKLTKYNAGSVCAKRVIVGNENVKLHGIMSAKVLHLASGGDRENPNVEKCFIDLGFEKKDDLKDKIEKGDFIAFEQELSTFGKDKLAGKSLSNRVAASLMIEFAESLKNNGIVPSCDLIFFFAVKEKVGMSDMFYAMQKFTPEIALILSALPAINSEKESNCKIGEGVVLPTHDGYSLYFGNDTYCDFIKSDIKHQIPKNIDEGQSSAQSQYSANGCMMFNVSLPVRNLHTPCEIVSLADIAEMEKAIKYFVEK